MYEEEEEEAVRDRSSGELLYINNNDSERA